MKAKIERILQIHVHGQAGCILDILGKGFVDMVAYG